MNKPPYLLCKTVSHRPWVGLMAVFQTAVVLVLLWLSADQSAHHKLHQLAESSASACSHHHHQCETTKAVDTHDSHSQEQGEHDASCVITLFAHGHASLMTLPPVVGVPAPRLLFLNGTQVIPVLPPSPQLLPHSCGPPSPIA